jgi:cobalamin biosynthesis protein CobW
MKIPATVITGFLGAGKTTGCGIAGCDDDNVLELANGCICCTVADDFLPTMEALLNRPEPPEHIVIETSGLALPKPLVRAFNWPEIRSRVTVDGVVTVVDAPAVAGGRFADDPAAVQARREADDSPLEEVFEDQLLSADLVLLNKSDMLDGAAIDAVRARVAEDTQPAVKMVHTTQGAIDPAVLLGIGAAVEDIIEGRRSHHDGDDDHDHDDFESFVVTLGTVTDPAALEARIKNAVLAHDILRVKGFIHVAGKDMRHVVQAVGPRLERYYDRPWRADEARSTELVVIGETGLDHDAIIGALSAG